MPNKRGMPERTRPQWRAAHCFTCGRRFEHPAFVETDFCPTCVNDQRAVYFERPLMVIGHDGTTSDETPDTPGIKIRKNKVKVSR